MIKPLFKTEELKSYTEQYIEKVKQQIIAILMRRGEQFVTECREQDTFEDQTGNLRSSIGYFIFEGNELVEKSFGGSEIEGQDAADTLVADIPKKEGVFYLIGVAGMNYAAAVESKGYNVISNQTLLILPLIEKDMHRIISKN